MIKKISLLISIIFCISLLVSSSGTFAASTSSKINSLESKSQALEKKIAAIKSDKSKQQQVKDYLSQQITNLQEQINIYNDEIGSLKSQISSLEKEIKEKEKEIEDTKTFLKQRIRAIYMSGSSNDDLFLLLGSNTVANYLSSRGIARSISAKDNSIIDEVNKAIDTIQKNKASIDAKIAQQKESKAALDTKQAALKQKENEINSVIKSLSSDQAQLEKDNKAVEAEIKRLYNEINAGMKSSDHANIKYNSGEYGWPVPGYYKVVSNYGTRWGRLHKGIDISGSGIYGKPIVAAKDGKVLVAGWSSGGYGNYVTINHGKDSSGNYYTTLYGHMSKIACSAGQNVKKGQVIGYIGSTGRSTGPHLHYEILVNGTAKNPLNWY